MRRRTFLGVSRRRRVATLLALAIVALPAARLSRASGPGALELHARFRDAGAVIPGNDVKVDGVTVGSVESVGLDDGFAVLTLSVTPAALPVYDDATAKVRPVSLLGERYVDLDRGTIGRPALGDGDELPVGQTGRAVDLDEVLSAVDDPTGTALATLLVTLGEGTAGRGADVAAALEALAPALLDTEELVGVLDEQNDVLLSLVERTGAITGALATHDGEELDALVETAAALFRATGSRAPDLGATIAELPDVVRSARGALREITALSEGTTPTLRSLRPLTGNLDHLAAELAAFSAAADPALASLDPVLDRGRELLDSARPVVAELRAAGPALRDVAHGARPIAGALLGGIDDVLNFLRNWALVTNGSDGLSHYFRAHIVLNPRSVPVATPELPLFDDPAALAEAVTVSGREEPGTRRPGEPVRPSVVDDLLDTVDQTLRDPGAVLDPLVDTATTPIESITGLTLTQEEGLLRSLLGGG